MIRYFEKQLNEFYNSIHSIDETEFKRWVDEAVEILKSGNKIVISGLGKNVPICEKIVGTMVSMGLNACFLHTNSAVHGDMGIIKDGDMVIILTKSGETSESVYLAKLLEKWNINMWLLTFAKESTLTKMISNYIAIDLKHEGDLWNIVPNNSTTMNLIVLQGLTMMIVKKMQINIWEFKRNHPGGNIGKLLENE